MISWPLWRVLVIAEGWLLLVATLYRVAGWPAGFVAAALTAVGPALVLLLLWLLRTRPPHSPRPSAALERAVAGTACLAAALWTLEWTLGAGAAVARMDRQLGDRMVIVDVSVTWQAIAACAAALTLDWLLSRTPGPHGPGLTWLRRVHVTVTAAHLAALFGAAWWLSAWPDASGADSLAVFAQARVALHVHAFAGATVLPVQACFAAAAVLAVVFERRASSAAPALR